MIPVYAPAGMSTRISRALQSSGIEVIVTRDWPEFERRCRSVSTCVLLVECLGLEVGHLSFARLSDRASRALRTVLVTRKDADNARCLNGLSFDDVVWFCEAERVLAGVLKRSGHVDRLGQLADCIDAEIELPPTLRRALATACRQRPPMRTVQSLAAAAGGMPRSTLNTQWRRAFGIRSAFRLQDFVGAVLLLRANERHVDGCKWTAVAAEMGVHHHTLNRIARRLAGASLAGLTSTRCDELVSMLHGKIAGRRFHPFCD